MQRLEATFHRTRSQRRPGSHRPCDALKVLCAKVLELEQIAQQSSCSLINHDSARFGDALQACREVRRLTDDAALLRFP